MTNEQATQGRGDPQVRFKRREQLTAVELSNWIRTGDTSGFGYTTQGIDYAQQYCKHRRTREV